MTNVFKNEKEKIILECEAEISKARKELDGIVARANGRLKWEPENRREIDKLVAEANMTYKWAVHRALDKKETRLQELKLQTGLYETPEESSSLKF